jgi:hypothetical protein
MNALIPMCCDLEVATLLLRILITVSYLRFIVLRELVTAETFLAEELELVTGKLKKCINSLV